MVSWSGYFDAIGGEAFGHGLQVGTAEADHWALGVASWNSRPTAVCGVNGELNIAECVPVVQRHAVVHLLFKRYPEGCPVEFAEFFRIRTDEQDGGDIVDQHLHTRL